VLDAGAEADADVHLEDAETARHVGLELVAHVDGVLGFGRVAVAADAVAELAAEELVDGDAVGFAGKVHERHLDGADATCEAGVSAKRFYLAEELVDVAGILAEDAALEHEGVNLAGAVADFAEAVDALVGVDADDGATE